ncbi:CYTH-like domain-containing protein [Crassisporium funariophilum]|nr:CYTH-like domain-containing protein [Crassisporium funariophilum]
MFWLHNPVDAEESQNGQVFFNSLLLRSSSNAPTLNLPTPPQTRPTTLPPLSLSILGVEPLDEFIKEIADFVHHMIVEAKVGVLRERGGGGRIGLPVLVETILAPDGMDLRFESNMSVHQHQHYNTLLNELKLQPTHAGSPLSYKHLHLIDNFFPSDPSSSNDKGKIRVTRDEKTNVVLECMRKIRLGDLNIYSPKQAADWRVSVNLEVPMAHPIGTPTHTRRKDRLSYAHEEFSIDLTQVTSSTAPNAPTQILHELEIEISRSELLLATAMKRNDPNVSEHEASAFDELIRAFVNNARILVRNSSEGWQ